MRLTLSALALSTALAAPAFAQGIEVNGGVGLSLTTEDDAGARQSGSLYVEGQLGGAFAGLSSEVYKDQALNEFTLYLGYRTMLGSLDVEGSYTRYSYPQDGGDCCGTVNVSLGLPLGTATSGLSLDYTPEDQETSAEISLGLPLANDRISLLGSFSATQTNGDGSSEVALGASYRLGESSAVQAQVYDGTDYDPYVGLDLTWDFSLVSR